MSRKIIINKLIIIFFVIIQFQAYSSVWEEFYIYNYKNTMMGELLVPDLQIHLVGNAHEIMFLALSENKPFFYENIHLNDYSRHGDTIVTFVIDKQFCDNKHIGKDTLDIIINEIIATYTSYDDCKLVKFIFNNAEKKEYKIYDRRDINIRKYEIVEADSSLIYDATINKDFFINELYDEKVIHDIKPKETLFSIAKYYGVSVEEIKKWNQINSDYITAEGELDIYISGNKASELQIEYNTNFKQKITNINEQESYNTNIPQSINYTVWFLCISTVANIILIVLFIVIILRRKKPLDKKTEY